ncbi:MAG: tRNA (adenosine(37)-N6)-threonylcarbamoyltransferase complex ATPase subunit type 1 TsaE [Planctomycetales bacterium]|nr:tRNA (adenosine(37)-N6)-threonylcarbamoyltransferase complex ATPase subunit type 1 TsaE [Planctomycetales bacterium]
MSFTFQTILHRVEDTAKLSHALATVLKPPAVLGLSGTLGVGKTQFIRSFAQALQIPSEEVTSPTYVLLQRYRATAEIYHLDFYRLEHASQVWDLGIDELYEQCVYVLIEWAEKFPECLPEERIDLLLTEMPDGSRGARLDSQGTKFDAVLQEVVQRL